MTSETLREPLVPLTTAYLLLGLGGVTCAFALFALLGRRYVTEEERLSALTRMGPLFLRSIPPWIAAAA